MTEEDINTICAMVEYGGYFIKSLGETARRADTNNLERIKVAFPEYWKRYSEMAKEIQNAKLKGEMK